jgi:hypothetical protein
MKKIVVAACALLLLLTPMVAWTQPSEVQATIDEIQTQVEEIRGLTAKNPVQIGFLNRDQLKQKLIEEFDAEWSPEDRRTDQELMVMLGFLEPTDDLYKIELDLLTEQVAGFYDPKDKELYLISGEQTLGAVDRYTMAHELTHALQDQYYQLDQPPWDVEESHNDDELTATSCLAEGDAMRVSNRYALLYIDSGELLLDSEDSSSSTQLLGAPEYIQDSLLFPYTEGTSFVSRAGGGSNTKVDAMFEDPPDSTEQIMHPDLYPKDVPQVVEIPDLSQVLASGWEQIEYNVLGEFDVLELFKSQLSVSRAREAAAGWDGNTYQYYRRGDGGKLLVQSYEWDTPDDAVEFAEAFEDYVPGRFADASSSEKDGWLRWEAGGYYWGLRLEGTHTDVVQATDREAAEATVGALGAGETFDSSAGSEQGEAPSRTWVAYVLIAALLVMILVLGLVVLLLRRSSRQQPPTPPTPPMPPRVPPPPSGQGAIRQ